MDWERKRESKRSCAGELMMPDMQVEPPCMFQTQLSSQLNAAWISPGDTTRSRRTYQPTHRHIIPYIKFLGSYAARINGNRPWSLNFIIFMDHLPLGIESGEEGSDVSTCQLYDAGPHVGSTCRWFSMVQPLIDHPLPFSVLFHIKTCWSH